ncbi:hypothetical protein SpCBS45565_g05081 [Spizellomyces sp. 'palustris']|nr:hypothetical protein SpCBS45565_g05081 [Spizellomyces sp. 'palustris']
MKKFLRRFSAAAAPAVFASPLEALIARDQALAKDGEEVKVPTVLRKFVTFLSSEQALRTEGIFRVAGSTKVVKDLRERIEKTGAVDFYDVPEQDIPSVASLFKQWIRDLPEALVPERYFQELQDAAGSAEDLQVVLQKLPPLNRSAFKYLLLYLLRVASSSSENKMTTSNISVVFAPNIFRCPSEPNKPGSATTYGGGTDQTSYFAESLVVSKVLAFVLDHFGDVFGAEEIDEDLLFKEDIKDASIKKQEDISGDDKSKTQPRIILKSSEAPDLFQDPLDDNEDSSMPSIMAGDSVPMPSIQGENPPPSQRNVFSKLLSKTRKRGATLTETKSDEGVKPVDQVSTKRPRSSSDPIGSEGQVKVSQKALIRELKSRLANPAASNPTFSIASKQMDTDEEDEENAEDDSATDSSASSVSEPDETSSASELRSTDFLRSSGEMASTTRIYGSNSGTATVPEKKQLVLPTKSRPKPPTRRPPVQKISRTPPPDSASSHSGSSSESSESSHKAGAKPAESRSAPTPAARPAAPYNKRKSVSFQLPISDDASSNDMRTWDTEGNTYETETTESSSEESEDQSEHGSEEEDSEEQRQANARRAPGRPAPPPPAALVMQKSPTREMADPPQDRQVVENHGRKLSLSLNDLAVQTSESAEHSTSPHRPSHSSDPNLLKDAATNPRSTRRHAPALSIDTAHSSGTSIFKPATSRASLPSPELSRRRPEGRRGDTGMTPITPITPFSPGGRSGRQDHIVIQPSGLRHEVKRDTELNANAHGRERSRTVSRAHEKPSAQPRTRSATITSSTESMQTEVKSLYKKIKEAKDSGTAGPDLRPDMARYRELKTLLQGSFTSFVPAIQCQTSSSRTINAAATLTSPTPTTPALPSSSRPVASLSQTEAATEIAIIKRELVNLKELYKHSEPTKEDREEMRDMYQRYCALKVMLEGEGSSKPDVSRTRQAISPIPPMSDTLKQYKKLRYEKKLLQMRLHKFQEDFMREHGRALKTADDRAPIAREYARYKDLKEQLAEMEAILSPNG